MYKPTTEDRVYMAMAKQLSTISKCTKKKVGALFVKDRAIISSGVNGTITCGDNKCESYYTTCTYCFNPILLDDIGYYNNTEKLDFNCPHCGKKFNKLKKNIDTFLKTEETVLHAEENGQIKAARLGISIEDSTLYVTMLPCIKCSRALIELRIKRIFYGEDYKNNASLPLLKKWLGKDNVIKLVV